MGEMEFIRGNICYILGDDGKPERVKIVSKKGTEFFLQYIGRRGILLKSENDMYHSYEEAVKAGE